MKTKRVSSLLCLLGASIPFLFAVQPNSKAAEPNPFEQIAYEDPFTGFKFPKMIGTYVFQGRAQYERVRLGYGINYLEKAGAKVTINVYDMDFTDVQDGIADSRVHEEFRKIEEGINGIMQQGGYRSATRVDTLPHLSKAWLQVNHELVDRNGVPLHAYSFIRGQNRKFVKIRVTTSSKGTYARLPSFLLGVSRAIGMLKSNEGGPIPKSRA